MTLDLEAVLATRSHGLPWRLPNSLPTTGDASLDAALAHMEALRADFATAP